MQDIRIWKTLTVQRQQGHLRSGQSQPWHGGLIQDGQNLKALACRPPAALVENLKALACRSPAALVENVETLLKLLAFRCNRGIQGQIPKAQASRETSVPGTAVLRRCRLWIRAFKPLLAVGPPEGYFS